MWGFSVTPYQALGLHHTATAAQIKEAHRGLAARYHPDREGGDAQVMALVNAAYGILSNPALRKTYDRFYRPKCKTCGGTGLVSGMKGFKPIKTKCPTCTE